MAAKTPDMFHSDHVFLRVASGTLAILGGISLLFILGCRLLGAEGCQLDWVPLFGGFDVFRRDLASINLPLAMLILGIGLRLYTPFGWTTSALLLLLLCTGFCLLAWRLSQELDTYWAMAAAQPEQAIEHPVMESIAVNLGLALFCLIFFIYLWLPKVRKLFWRPGG